MIENITQEFLNMIKLPSTSGKRLNYLIVMPRITSGNIAYMFPTGLAYVSSAIKASGRNVMTLNLNYKGNYLDLLRNKIIENKVDVVMTGGLSGQYKELREIVDTAKSAYPNIITIVGGGIISAEPDVAMSALENTDYGVIGEGEITINALAYALENNEAVEMVEGVVSKICKYPTPPPPPPPSLPEILDLDCLPFPDYDGLEFRELLTKENSSLMMRTSAPSVAISRSCPFSCTFCFHSSGKNYRRRSVNNVIKEIEWIIDEYAIRSFIFCDELFIDKSNFIYEFCDKIKPLQISYWAQTRVDSVSKDVLVQLKESGCNALTFGVESADNTILKSMRKNTTVAQIERAYNLASEVGLKTDGNIIFGDLEETSDTIRNSLNWIRLHKDYSIGLAWILTFPGSHLYKVACERGIIPDRVKYLRDGKFQINVSRMSAERYAEMVEEVGIFDVLRSIGDVFDADLFKINIEGIVSKCKVAVWPAVNSNIDFLHKYVPEALESNNLYLVNSRPTSMYSPEPTRYGKWVNNPNIIDEEEITAVIYFYKGTFAKPFSDHINQHYPQVERIYTISDLLQ